MKKFFIISCLIIFFIFIGIFSFSFGNEEIPQNNQKMYGKVTTDSLRIRSGIGTNNLQIGILKKDNIVHIYDKIDNWYIIKTEQNIVGAVCADYVEVNYENEKTIETSANIEKIEKISNINLSKDEQIFFNLINNKRIENNLPELKLDEELLNLARLKCNDIVQTNNFSHNSKKLGTLYEMLSNNHITYTIASENIARGINADSAIQSLMNSESHKNNILSQNYNYTGISVLNSATLGKVFVEIFISK